MSKWSNFFLGFLLLLLSRPSFIPSALDCLFLFLSANLRFEVLMARYDILGQHLEGVTTVFGCSGDYNNTLQVYHLVLYKI